MAMGKLETHGEFNMNVKYINIITLSGTDLLDICCHYVEPIRVILESRC